MVPDIMMTSVACGCHACAHPGYRYRGTSLIRNTPPWDPTEALCLGTYGDPGWMWRASATPAQIRDTVRGGKIVH